MRRLVGLALAAACISAHADKTDLSLIGQQGDYYFLTVSQPWAGDKALVERAVRGMCEGKTFCFAHLWDKKSGAPKKMQMTDKQSNEMLAMHRKNQNTGLSQIYFNCKKFKGIPKDQCL